MKRWPVYFLLGLLLILGVGLFINRQAKENMNPSEANSNLSKIASNSNGTSDVSMKVILSHEQREVRYLSPLFDVSTKSNIVYANKKNETENEEPLNLDLYEPARDNNKQRPVFIFIHGGGYKEGSKEDAASISMKLAERGYVVLSMNYRLKTDPFNNFALTLSDAYEDISDVIGWIHDNAAAYGLDPEKIVIGGDSAGGYLAMNFANEYLRNDPSLVKPVLAIVDIYGGLLENSVHKKLPPVLIIHGTIDAMIPYWQSLDLNDILEQHGIYHNLFTMEGAGHDYKNEKFIDDVVETITHFLWNVMSSPETEELPENAGLAAVSGDLVDIKLPNDYVLNSGEAELQVFAPLDWSLVESEESQNVYLQVPAGLEPGNYTIFVNMVRDDRAASASGFVINVKVLNPLKESFETYFDAADQKMKTHMTLTNQSKHNFNGSLQVNYETEQGNQGTFTTDVDQLEPGKSIVMIIPELASGERRVRGYDVSGKLVHRSGDFLHALKIDKPHSNIRIDGELKEWKDCAVFDVGDVKMKDWNGEDDASATGFLCWDPANLYLALEVTDDKHVQSSSGSEIWNGDGIQFAIGIANADGGNPPEYHEFGLAMDDEGQLTKWRWLTPPGFSIQDFFETELAIHRKNQITVYEVAIPWDELILNKALVRPGMKLKFSLLLNDNDGDGRKGWLEFNSGIGTAKDIHAFGDIYLTD
ncbi:acetyl esterase/lipase [Fontibacillus phaseoli]|uniref:Acetyl esterase/lipase n=1 Tax=Fontibacillus phaseoli TaxID=1416533 RepID=A0A369BLH6_9BACL|nr:alpha/beta hydrolase fold domain-containing protein [Fontibacillus phaseoli]RCX21446.1 acetyl esterase/lipase [Fontibacillus phaseoli]